MSDAAPTIELSFDDAPRDSEAVRQISRILYEEEICSDFFAIGSAVKENREVLRYLHDCGHAIQNHSWSHSRLDALDLDAVRAELEQTQEAVFSAVAEKPTKFRAPYGAGSWRAEEAPHLWSELERLHLTNVTWDVDPEDWRPPRGLPRSKIEDLRLQIVRKISRSHIVVLLHATSETANDLPDLLLQLRRWKLEIISNRSNGAPQEGYSPPSRHCVLKALEHRRERSFKVIWAAAEAQFNHSIASLEKRGQFEVAGALVQTLVAGEDRRFFRHSGFDVYAIARACWRRLNGQREGASTIPQQLARVLTGRYERTLRRKVLEIRIAVRLTAKFSKSDIATLYLHIAYYGWRMNSLGEAARRLGIRPQSCSLAEAARIVARLKYPQPEFPSFTRLRLISTREQHLLRLARELGSNPLC